VKGLVSDETGLATNITHHMHNGGSTPEQVGQGELMLGTGIDLSLIK
jgi:hypothetical protein